MIGLLFPTENDARNFHKQVVGRKELKVRPLPIRRDINSFSPQKPRLLRKSRVLS